MATRKGSFADIRGLRADVNDVLPARAMIGGTVRTVKPGGSGSYATIQAAVTAAQENDTIMVAPGGYAETVTVPRTKAGLLIVGVGGRGAAYIEPSVEDAHGLIVNADDVTVVNLGAAGEDETSAIALSVTGGRFRAIRSKFEGGLDCVNIGPGTVAQEAAGTHGRGADALFEDCEFAWAVNGVRLKATDYGAVTQARFRGCRFHNLSASSFEEAGGSVDIRYRNLLIDECFFENMEDGTVPTKFISLNDDNGNKGVVARCTFPVAIDSGNNLVSTGLLWVSNFHTGGVSAAQPS